MFELDTTLQNVFMTVFFTSVGFTCDVRVLLKYGKRAIQFTIVLALLVCFQNAIGVGLAKLFDINLLLGLCTGSASMTGGHGTAGSFAPLFESMYGCEGAWLSVWLQPPSDWCPADWWAALWEFPGPSPRSGRGCRRAEK